jgi:outer membrane lipoprotein SlyB
MSYIATGTWKGRGRKRLLLAVALAALSSAAWAQSSVQFGRITNVNLVNTDSSGAQVGGALVGGTLGAAVGSGRSGSNRILGGVGGAVAGQQLGRMATRGQAFQYTILIGSSTITMVTDEAGLRVGDCVAVERGQFNNLRLVDDARCAPGAAAAAPAAVQEADACIAAKNQLLAAQTDEAFDRAERRVRLLCGD